MPILIFRKFAKKSTHAASSFSFQPFSHASLSKSYVKLDAVDLTEEDSSSGRCSIDALVPCTKPARKSFRTRLSWLSKKNIADKVTEHVVSFPRRKEDQRAWVGDWY